MLGILSCNMCPLDQICMNPNGHCAHPSHGCDIPFPHPTGVSPCDALMATTPRARWSPWPWPLSSDPMGTILRVQCQILMHNTALPLIPHWWMLHSLYIILFFISYHWYCNKYKNHQCHLCLMLWKSRIRASIYGWIWRSVRDNTLYTAMLGWHMVACVVFHEHPNLLGLIWGSLHS